MHTLIADALVLVLSPGDSLRQWQARGILSREWALYRELLPCYHRIVFVTYGKDDDMQALTPLLRRETDQRRIGLLANSSSLPLHQFAASLPMRAQSQLAGCNSLVIKTHEMDAADVAVRIADGLTRHGKRAALIARGGHLWTRFIAHDHGPHSTAATEAAAREKALCTAAHAVVGPTDDMVADLAWRYGLDPTRTAVLPNYVITDQDPAPVEERDKKVLLTASDLIPRKRIHLLIESMALIPPDERNGIRLEVIGDGPERQKLEELAKRENAPVTFHARIPHDQLLEKMRRCALYLHASELESHPKTILEAMSSGAVVLAADAPGTELIHHGLSGLRLAPEPRLFAHAITELLADTEWRAALGTAASNAVRAPYSLPAILQQEIAIHRRAMEAAKRARSRAVA
jgi:glycosyltransferase involved in cell wall biosynthesis